MDKTKVYFAKYYLQQEEGERALAEARAQLQELKLATSTEDKRSMKQGLKENVIEQASLKVQELLVENEKKLIEAAVSAMDQAVAKDGYDLIIDDIKDILNCDDRFVADYILEHVDYIDAPRFSSHYFNKNYNYTCIDQIKLIWKKVFISRASFTQYLIDNATVKFVTGTWKNGKLIVPDSKSVQSVQLTRSMADVLITSKRLFRRRCNLGEVIITDKFYSFSERIFDKYLRDFVGSSFVSGERLKLEKELIYNLKPEDLHLQVRSKEITDFIKKHPHMELTLNCPGTLERNAKRTDIADTEKLRKADTSTVLYCFNSVIRESIQDRLEQTQVEDEPLNVESH